MKVLVACEESQRVCMAFRELGHEAYSCDIIEPSGGHPEWHILGDVLKILNPEDQGNNCMFIAFKTMDGKMHTLDKWDLIIAHPPCTYLCNTSQRWLHYGTDEYRKSRLIERTKANKFFMRFVKANCKRIAIENPVGIMSTLHRKPDCIYNPYDFDGETECKKTCLWLKNLPPLRATQILDKSKRTHEIFKSHFNGKVYSWNSQECKKNRSKTPIGVAKAMAKQWSEYIEQEGKDE